jgi:hypothetical protein
MKIKAFGDLRLVGGTALALQLGHRNSVDINMFGPHSLDDRQIAEALVGFQEVEIVATSKSIKVYFIDGVKVDFVNYPYLWLDPEMEVEGIRMASTRDIAAMKIAAITQRGSKKDFIDLYFLLQQFSLPEILGFYEEKIRDSNRWLALRSIPYFTDADQQPTPAMHIDVSWEEVKTTVQHAVSQISGF